VQKSGCICEAYVQIIRYGMSRQSGAAGVGVVITGEILEPGTLGGFFDGFKARGRGHLRSTGMSSAALASGSGLDQNGLLYPPLTGHRACSASLVSGDEHIASTLSTQFSPICAGVGSPVLCVRPKHQKMSLKWAPCSDQLHSLSERSILPPKAACSTDEGLDLPSSYRRCGGIMRRKSA
jgi:hypothetical protein